jgi:hypothetical protein
MSTAQIIISLIDSDYEENQSTKSPQKAIGASKKRHDDSVSNR